jgi:two-component system CheB/CheR fusion protein
VGFPVVGVGASAGGLDAFRRLLAHVPADSGLAFVLVQHLQASRVSLLSDALAHATTMKVAQAEQGARVEPNRVYVIPPGTQMAIEHGLLKLSELDEDEHRPHLPIDFFLRSLAAERGREAIGVILSGRASDGTAGLAAIRARGGITFAQDPRSASFGGMPQSAVAAGVVDFCLPLPALAAELARLARHPYLAWRDPVPPTPAGAASQARVIELVRSSTGVDFGEHKPASVHRRLARRMAARQVEDVASYLEVLKRDPAEVRTLYDDLLIKLTSFFRDEAGFDGLEATAFPEILRHKPPAAPIRAWVVGCATGEEVYSLAISLLEHLGRSAALHPVLIIGSDLSEPAIATARAGLYPDAAVRGLGEARLRRFFTRTERGWRVKQAVRELCVFARHDVARDPPFSRLDLVSCRNVLSYFNPALQRRVISAAHYGLNEPGYLLLGRSETAHGLSNWFAPTGKRGRLFARRPGPSGFRFTAHARAAPSARTPPAAEAEERALVAAVEDRPSASTSPRRAGRPAKRRALEEELATARERLAVLLDAQARANDALSSANDGLVSGNEELHGLNEELETAQEELQATNEELSTVNEELQARNRDLQVANADVLNLLDAVELPILVLDGEQLLRRFTRPAAALLALTPADVGRRITELPLPSRAPDLTAWIARSMAEARPIETELQDGSGRWHRLQIRPHRAADGRPDGAILSLVDIDALRRGVLRARWARDYARSIVEAVQTPLVVLDTDLRVLSANAPYYRFFGEEPGRTEGHDLYELGAGEWEIEALHRAMGAVQGANGSFQALELEGNLGHRTVSASGCAVAAPGGAMILLAIEDVTERRQAERHQAELLAHAEEARQRAERADAAKDLLLASVSHELRSPLTAILLHAEVLQRGQLEAAAVGRAAGAIVACTRRQARLVEDLLDLSRSSSGTLDLAVEEVDLGELVAGVLEAMRPEVEAKSVQLQVDLPGGPLRLLGDPPRVQQVVANLVGNAVKFTPGGGRVSVRLEAEDGTARLVVTDTGRGIDPAFLPHVFERFSQEAQDGRRSSGLGLGLAVVRHLVELHGGTVGGESPGPGLGSTFTVVLPRPIPADPASRTASAPKPNVHAGAPNVPLAGP